MGLVCRMMSLSKLVDDSLSFTLSLNCLTQHSWRAAWSDWSRATAMTPDFTEGSHSSVAETCKWHTETNLCLANVPNQSHARCPDLYPKSWCMHTLRSCWEGTHTLSRIVGIYCDICLERRHSIWSPKEEGFSAYINGWLSLRASVISMCMVRTTNDQCRDNHLYINVC